MIWGTKWQELKLPWEMELSENYLTFLQTAAYFQCNILNYTDDLFEVYIWSTFFLSIVVCLTGMVSSIIFYSAVNNFLFLMLAYSFIL